MLDEKDIELLSNLIDQKISASERRMMTSMSDIMDQKISDSERRMMVMMESYFDPKFAVLEEKLNPVPREAFEIIEDRMDDAEKTLQLHTRQIDELKKAQ